jgi:hypothetical protein
MANQMIALQTRNPQLPDPSKMTAQYATLMNMAQQNETAKRQAAQAQQQMDFAAAKEDREKEMQPFAVGKAKNEAFSAQQKAVLDFMDLSYETIKRARSPEDVINGAGRLKQNFPDPVFADLIDQTVATLPADPSQFSAWKQTSERDTLSNVQRLEQVFKTQNTGTEQREIAMPKYGGGAAVEVPGSRFAAAQGKKFIRDANGAVYSVDDKTGGGFDTPAPAVGTPPPAGSPGRGGPVANALKTNPGAIKDGPFAQRQAGYTGKSGGFATFDSPASGIAAQESLLRGAYVNKGFNTIDKIINKYAPQGKENSGESVRNYKNYVARRAGVDIGTVISAAQIPAVAQAMREFETDNKVGVGSGGGANAAPGGLTQILPGKPAKGDISPEKRKARDLAVQDLYNAVVEAERKGHLVSDKQSYVANRAAELRQGRPYVPGGTAQKTSLDNIEANAAQLLRQIIQEGTSGTLNAVAEQKLFLKGVGGADSTYETRLRTIRNFAKQNGIKLNEAGTAKPKAQAPRAATPTTKAPAGVSAAEWNAMTPAERKLWQ